MDSYTIGTIFQILTTVDKKTTSMCAAMLRTQQDWHVFAVKLQRNKLTQSIDAKQHAAMQPPVEVLIAFIRWLVKTERASDTSGLGELDKLLTLCCHPRSCRCLHQRHRRQNFLQSCRRTSSRRTCTCHRRCWRSLHRTSVVSHVR